jgi:hypothetical protein
MEVTRKELKEMSWTYAQNALWYESISIGQCWERNRNISFSVSNEGVAILIVVTGKPRQGKWLVCKFFPLTEEGFQAAKDFALK